MSQVTIEQAASRLPDLIEQVAQGGEVILTKDNQPVAKLVAVPQTEPPKPREPGLLKGTMQMSPDFDEPLEDFAEYM